MEDLIFKLFGVVQDNITASKYLKNKTIYCNCVNPVGSDYFYYLKNNFINFKLKKVVIVGKCDNDKARKITIEKAPGGTLKIKYEVLFGSGKLISHESVEVIKEADIIISTAFFVQVSRGVKLIEDYGKLYLIAENLGGGLLNWYTNIPPII